MPVAPGPVAAVASAVVDGPVVVTGDVGLSFSR